MLNQAFKTIQDKHGVSAARLSELTGIAQSTISNYRNGKRDTHTETLWKLLNAIEQESPGAINDFASELGRVEIHGLTDREKKILIWSLPESELAEILRLIGDRLAKSASEKSLTAKSAS
jgi:transcriptional regulator with XRE-family HTH domain